MGDKVAKSPVRDYGWNVKFISYPGIRDFG